MWTSVRMSVFLSGCLTLLMLEEPPLHSISLESSPRNNGSQESVYLASVGVTLMCWSGLLAVSFRALNHTASTAVIGVQKSSAKKAALSTKGPKSIILIAGESGHWAGTWKRGGV